MKLKDILLEMEPADADFNKKEEADNAFMQKVIEENDGEEINFIILNSDDLIISALISFDKNNYIKLSKFTIDEGELGDLDMKQIEKKAALAVEKELDKLFDGEEKLPSEIEIKI